MIVFGNKQALQTNFIIKKETQLTSPFWFLKMDFSSVVGVAIVLAPFSFDNFKAAIVSAVSPD